MTVALVANIARPISSAISTAFSADSYGKLDAYGKIGAWSPLSLFASSEVGAWYDPSDLTTMFQDRAGTTPVTADGQTVGKILDKSGRGNHATAPSDAARPLYKTDGTYRWLQFDGVDDSLSTAAIDFTATDKMNVFTGINRVLNTAGRKTIVMFMGDPWSVNGSFELDSPDGGSDAVIGLRGTQRSAQIFPLVASLNVLTAKYDLRGTSYVTCTEVRQNGVSLNPGLAQSSPTAGTGNFGNGSLSVAKIINQNSFFGGHIYSLIVRSVLSTPDEITNTETWVNSKTGAWA